MSKVKIGSRRELQIKIFQVLLRVIKGEVVDLKLLNLLSRIVERNILGSV